MDVRWVAVAATLTIGGIGVLMKVSDGSLKNRKVWGTLGTVFILTGVMVMGALILGTFGVQFRSPIVFGDKQPQEAKAQFLKWPDPYSPVSVINKTFRNEEVLLDGYSYDHCTFENVTFVYNGTTAPQVMFPTVRGSFNLGSDNVAVEGSLAVLKGFGMLQPDVNIQFSNPNNILKGPGEPVE